MTELEEYLYKQFLEHKPFLDGFLNMDGVGVVNVPIIIDGVVDQVCLCLKTKRYKHIKYAVATKGVVGIEGQIGNAVLCDEYEYKYLDLEKLLYE